MQDNNSKWEFDAPKFWDLSGLLQKKLPSDSWFNEHTVSGPSFPVISHTKKKRLIHPEASHSLSFKYQSGAKRQKTNNDVFSRLSATATVSSAIKTNNHRATHDVRIKKHSATQKTALVGNPLRESPLISSSTKPSKNLHEAEPKEVQTSTLSKKQSLVFSSKDTPQTPPEQIRSLSYEPDTPPPPSPEKSKKNTNFKLLHRKHMRIVNDLRNRIKRSTTNVEQ
ncbi:hypothetical protein BY458DRAFT_520739 [Sporodiniella umbellata]|nr:hypothetical protein BY458DRAFT_520739 [Sporodiniella umbellata]